MALVILVGALVLLGLFSWLISKYKTPKNISPDRNTAATNSSTTEDILCCGQYTVCEQESLLYQGDEIVYYDDEELDAYRGLSAEIYDEVQLQAFEEVFYSLQPEDVAGWLRSLQLRDVNLPMSLREEACMILSERRQNAQ